MDEKLSGFHFVLKKRLLTRSTFLLSVNYGRCTFRFMYIRASQTFCYHRSSFIFCHANLILSHFCLTYLYKLNKSEGKESNFIATIMNIFVNSSSETLFHLCLRYTYTLESLFLSAILS